VTAAYYCGATNSLIEGHRPDECAECLRKNRDYFKGLICSNVETKFRTFTARIAHQRSELARLNDQVAEYGQIITSQRNGEKRAAAVIFGFLAMAEWARRVSPTGGTDG
jgi:hypothetical protein